MLEPTPLLTSVLRRLEAYLVHEIIYDILILWATCSKSHYHFYKTPSYIFTYMNRQTAGF